MWHQVHDSQRRTGSTQKGQLACVDTASTLTESVQSSALKGNAEKMTKDIQIKQMFERMREFTNDRQIVIVAPKAPPPTPHPVWIPQAQIVVHDYITLLKP